MREWLPQKLYLRKNDSRWPPMHTPIVWQRNIPNRSAVMMQTLPGGFQGPTPAVLSLVTGKTELQRFQRPRFVEPVDRSSAAAVGRGKRNAGDGNRHGRTRRAGAEPRAGHDQTPRRQRGHAVGRQIVGRRRPASGFTRRAAAVAGENSAHPQFAVASAVCAAGQLGGLAAGAGSAIKLEVRKSRFE